MLLNNNEDIPNDRECASVCAFGRQSSDTHILDNIPFSTLSIEMTRPYSGLMKDY